MYHVLWNHSRTSTVSITSHSLWWNKLLFLTVWMFIHTVQPRASGNRHMSLPTDSSLNCVQCGRRLVHMLPFCRCIRRGTWIPPLIFICILCIEPGDYVLQVTFLVSDWQLTFVLHPWHTINSCIGQQRSLSLQDVLKCTQSRHANSRCRYKNKSLSIATSV